VVQNLSRASRNCIDGWLVSGIIFSEIEELRWYLHEWCAFDDVSSGPARPAVGGPNLPWCTCKVNYMYQLA
jgi:hypothetical protein